MTDTTKSAAAPDIIFKLGLHHFESIFINAPSPDAE
jgi:hypothetical protein